MEIKSLLRLYAYKCDNKIKTNVSTIIGHETSKGFVSLVGMEIFDTKNKTKGTNKIEKNNYVMYCIVDSEDLETIEKKYIPVLINLFCRKYPFMFSFKNKLRELKRKYE